MDSRQQLVATVLDPPFQLENRGPRAAGSLLGLLVVGWVAIWFSIGLSQGDLLIALRPGLAEHLRVLYIVALYLWLMIATTWCWKRFPPSWVSLGRPAQFLKSFGLGLGLLVAHRGCLWILGLWHPPSGVALSLLALAFLTSPLLAISEELVFRGYLYGNLRGLPGRIGVSLFFALLHLFRPGGLTMKLALGFGLFAVSWLLIEQLERKRTVMAPAGLHASWVIGAILDPPGNTSPHWFSGLGGEAIAGVLSWLQILTLLLWWRRTDSSKTQPPRGHT